MEDHQAVEEIKVLLKTERTAVGGRWGLSGTGSHGATGESGSAGMGFLEARSAEHGQVAYLVGL